jgi:8-oxo-dGTP pyrophosphatase MutT (NUDIX family)
LPGGRAELGEGAQETLEREMMEELGLPTTVERPLFLVENFYRHGHEIGLYFLMTFPPSCYLYQGSGPFELGLQEDTDLPLVFAWLPIDQFDHLTIKPTFFNSALQKPLPQYLTHVVNRGM